MPNRLPPRLGRPFFEGPCVEVARRLVGCLLVHRLASGEALVVRLVEVEAYLGEGSDPASHAHPGPTTRNRAMFGPPGHLYVYRSYGIHRCLNVVCEAVGHGAAVLLRAAEPLEGIDAMRAARSLAADAPLAAVATGPGRLAQALGVGLEADGTSLLRGALSLHAPTHARPALELAVGPRVGITRAAHRPLRFFDANSPFVSAYRPGRRRSFRR